MYLEALWSALRFLLALCESFVGTHFNNQIIFYVSSFIFEWVDKIVEKLSWLGVDLPRGEKPRFVCVDPANGRELSYFGLDGRAGGLFPLLAAFGPELSEQLAELACEFGGLLELVGEELGSDSVDGGLEFCVVFFILFGVQCVGKKCADTLEVI